VDAPYRPPQPRGSFPFSFREVLDLKGIDALATMTTIQAARVQAEFDLYLMDGGIPSHVPCF